jgi:ABC-2 type transport system permease protein
MSKFLWLIRREVWEHKAIWVAPSIVIGCLFAMLLFAQHLRIDFGSPFSALPREGQIVIHQFAYFFVAVIVFLVMGVIAFFYSIDALYADRHDRSVLFWKSLPLSDAESVLSKFATGIVVIPLVAMVGSIVAQVVAGGGLMARLAMAGQPVGLWWHPEALAGGAMIALATCVTAMLWYAPLVAYLMLASAWAPRAPFLWAVLPPVAAIVLEKIVLQSSYVQDLVASRLLGMYEIFSRRGGSGDVNGLGELADRLGRIDVAGRLREFYGSPELWLGVVAAALLLAAAIWVRRYRDETT